MPFIIGHDYRQLYLPRDYECSPVVFSFYVSREIQGTITIEDAANDIHPYPWAEVRAWLKSVRGDTDAPNY